MYRIVPISSRYGVEGLVTSPAIAPDPALTPANAPRVRNRRRSLPDETGVLPGHMGPTTLGTERASNPFLRELAPR